MPRTRGRVPLSPDALAALLPDGVEATHQRYLVGNTITATFANGYGVSIIDHDGSYDLELGVLHPDSLCYATPVTSDVLGYLTDDEARAAVLAVQALPENPTCGHVREDLS